MRAALLLLGSARLTVLLFLAFLLLFLIGLFVPQVPLATAEQVGRFAQGWPRAAATARAMGWDDVYHSTWLHVAFALFAGQLAFYLARRVPALRRDSLLATGDPPERLPERRDYAAGRSALASLADALRSRRYRVVVGPGRLVAVRNRHSPFWGLVLHASFAVLLLGAWVVRASALHGTALLTEGQAFTGQREEFAQLEPAGRGAERILPVAFEVEAIDPVFGDGHSATDITVRLQLETGLLQELGVNRPVTIGDVEVLIRDFGLAPVFTVLEHDRGRPRPVDVLSPRLVCWSPGLPSDSFRLQRPAATVDARFWPMLRDGPDGPTSLSMSQRNPVLGLTVRAEDAAEPCVEQRLRVGESARFGSYELRLEELRTWGEFLITREAGGVLLLGFLMLVLGSAMRLLFPRRLVVAEFRERTDTAPTRLVLGGHGEYFPLALAHELDTVARHLGLIPRATTPIPDAAHGQD